MRTVEVHSDRAAFPEMLGAMREWLDRNSRPLVRFETEANGDIVTIKVRLTRTIWPRAFDSPLRAATTHRNSG